MENKEPQQQLKEPTVRKSPLDMFFALGDKVTKGDPERKADYDYYMLWVIFLAFFGVFFGNLRNFWITHEFQFLGWTLFGFAIMWFQFFNLKSMWDFRKTKKEMNNNQEEKSEDIESVEDMLNGFNKKEKKETNKNETKEIKDSQNKVGNSVEDRKRDIYK